jgi:hypothetical protein
LNKEHNNSSVSVKEILGYAWEKYIDNHEVTEYQRKEVKKALECYDKKRGCFVYYCAKCNEHIFESMGCNSRVCSCCGKRYTEQWSYNLSHAMFPVPHRHFVMSVPSVLWSYLRDWEWLKKYMDTAIATFNDFFSKILRQEIKVGVIVILHPFGKDMKFQPHLHLIITEGGYNRNKTFCKCEFIPADKFRVKWQYEILKTLQGLGLPNSIATYCYTQYRKGFYVWLHKRGTIKHPKIIAKYVGRYVRHPAIANSRIDSFDGKTVHFHYIDGEDIRREVSMNTEQFITALIQHIPPTQFKMIRYYGAYSRTNKRLFGGRIQSSIKQLNLYHFGMERTKYCPKCGSSMEFVWYSKKPPEDLPKSQKELSDWISINY